MMWNMSRTRRRVARTRAEKPRRTPSPRRTPTSEWREVALALACVVLAILLLALDPTLRNVFDLPKAAFSHGAAWVLAAVLVLVAAKEGLRIPRSPLFIAMYVLVGVEVLTTLTATSQYVALYGEVGRYLGLTTHLVLALVAIALAVGIEYPRRASWLGWTLAAASVAAGGYAVVQALGADPIHWVDLDSKARPFATLGNPDFYGQYLSAAAIASAAIVVFSRVRWLRAAAGALAVASTGLLILSATRGAVIGAVAGVAALGVLWLRRSGATRAALARIGLAGLAFVAALGVVVLTTPLGDRLLALTDVANVQDRVRIYTAATRVFLDHPILGVGFENFAVAYPRYAEAEGVHGNQTQTSSHNWLLHLAATSGIAGLAATAFLLVAFGVHTWRRARDEDATPLLAAAGALVAFYTSGLVLPGAQAIQWVPWACLGVALASDVRTAPAVLRLPPVRLPALAQIALVVVAVLLATPQAQVLEANRLAKTSETSLRAETAQQSVDAARVAVADDPGRAVYWNDLGRALELVNDPDGARRAYLEATARSPYTPAFWWNLGRMDTVFARDGDSAAKPAAYDAFAKALAASPQNPDTYDQLARSQLTLGDYAAALASEERAIALYPLDTRYYTVGADAARLAGNTTRSLDLLREGVAATGSNELRLVLAQRLIDGRSDLEARAVLTEVLRTDPTNATALALMKQIGAQ